MGKKNQISDSIYSNALIWDAHAGFELTSERDLETLSVWKDAGINYLSVNVGYDVRDWRTTIKNLSLARRWIDKQQDIDLIGTISELNLARSKGHLAVTFDIEGMCAFDESIEMVQLYYDLGVRQIAFAYNLNNAAGGGCHDVDIGLTNFGRDVIREMNRVGMFIDCSHASYTTTMEAMEVSDSPVIFSHSNSRVIHNHERNIWDDQAIACAATGGIVGVNGIGVFLGQDDISSANMARHILHYVNLIGAKHVGIGVDYELSSLSHKDKESETFDETLADNPDFWPPEQYPGGAVSCASPLQIHEITGILLSEGLKTKEVEGILGGNFRRIAE
ncbi:MAG: membrane dipeptidase, partial [Paracoccaceae bacterium]|nr:membrane dipeptidase [Paracoccaceae bacterium]